MPEEEVTDSTIEEMLPGGATKKKPEEKPILKDTKESKKETKDTQKQETKKKEFAQVSTEKVTKPDYKYMGRIPLSQLIRKNISKEFIPTNRIASILGVIFLAVVILALLQFPFGRLISGDVNIVTKIGYPFPFLELKIMDPGETPLIPINLFYDMLIYIFLSYVIDVIINFILNAKLIKSEEELRNKPKVYKDINSSVADKLTKKIFKEKNPSEEKKPATKTEEKPKK